MLVEMGGLCIHGINLFYLSSGKFALRLWSPYPLVSSGSDLLLSVYCSGRCIGGQAYTSWNA